MESGNTGGRLVRRSVVVFFCVVGLIAVGVGVIGYLQWTNRRAFRQRQAQVWRTTDRAALRDACREVWQERSVLGKNDGEAYVIDPADPRLPGAIRNLDAHQIDAYESGMYIELGGNWGQYGFETIVSDPARDTKRNLWKDVYPSADLGGGLWFYSEIGVPGKK